MHLPRRTPYICESCLKRVNQQALFISRRQIGGNVVRRAYSSAAIKDRPFRLAVIGSGPAGFYAAGRVMKEHGNTVVDMYERLPIPFGLVRYGVAPDHPEVKNCEDRFEEIGESPNFNFIGNVSIGRDVSLSSIKPHYDAILFAYGASKDQKLGIPGEGLPAVYSAREFVAWYNGLPGFSDLKPQLDLTSSAVIIGQGNVALDVARVLLTDVDKFRKTDMPEYAVDALSKNRVKTVHVVGRRGAMQAAFTIKEIREIIQMPGVHFHSIPKDLFPTDLASLPRPRRRIAELLLKSGKPGPPPGDSNLREFFLDFLLTPKSFDESSSQPLSLRGLTFQPTKYHDRSSLANPTAAVTPDPNASPIFLDAGVAFRSIGYKAEPLPSLSSIGVPFDDRRGVIPNQFGRVLREEGATVAPAADLPELRGVVPGVYVAGWVKRGPTGVIASTMEDAFQSGDAVVEDAKSEKGLLNEGEGTGLGWDGVRKDVECRRVRWTGWRDWRRIDEVERERGERLGKPREKIVSVEEMLRVLDR